MKYIPQAAPFVMIDELISVGEQDAVTCFLVRKGHLFEENNQFTEPGLIENMAQTAAAGIGFKAAGRDKPPAPGFIGQIKNLEIYRLPEMGETLMTTVKDKNKIMNVLIAEGSIQCGGKPIARAEFKVFLQEP
jgi:predicted hotdog family 3-hydroxylacyl-ACP dehydratase